MKSAVKRSCWILIWLESTDMRQKISTNKLKTTRNDLNRIFTFSLAEMSGIRFWGAKFPPQIQFSQTKMRQVAFWGRKNRPQTQIPSADIYRLLSLSKASTCSWLCCVEILPSGKARPSVLAVFNSLHMLKKHKQINMLFLWTIQRL